MIKVNSDTKTAYKTDSVHKELEIRIPNKNITLHNSDLVAQSLSLTESIETSNNLSFTGCVAAVLKFRCADIVTDIEGEYIEVDIKALLDGTTTPPTYSEVIPLFRGYIDKSGNHSHEQNTMDITAYDALYSKINNVDVTSWYNSLPASMTIKSMRDSFFTYVEVEQETDYLPNDNIAVTKTLQDKTILGATIIKAICQVNGRFGRISRNGRFQYVHLNVGTEALYPREDLYPADDLYPSTENAVDNVSKAHYSSIEFENYRVAAIDKVQLVNKEGSIVKTVGTGFNPFTLNNNFLIWGLNASQLTSVADNLFNTIEGLWYIPATIDCVGLPYVECGDFVMMIAKRSIIRSYVLNRTLTGIQALKDNFEAVGDKEQPVYTPSVKTQIAANSYAIDREISDRQTAISSEASARAQGDQINANAIQAETVRAKSVEATKATIEQLNATNANVANLTANVANISNLVATKASIDQLNAVSARVGRIEANYITANQVDAKISTSLRTYAGRLNCTSISIGGTTYSRARTINLFDSNGNYYGQATVLST